MGFRDDTAALKAQLSSERRRAEQERRGLEMELEVLQRERRALQRQLDGRVRKVGFWRRKNAAKFALAAVALIVVGWAMGMVAHTLTHPCIRQPVEQRAASRPPPPGLREAIKLAGRSSGDARVQAYVAIASAAARTGHYATATQLHRRTVSLQRSLPASAINFGLIDCTRWQVTLGDPPKYWFSEVERHLARLRRKEEVARVWTEIGRGCAELNTSPAHVRRALERAMEAARSIKDGETRLRATLAIARADRRSLAQGGLGVVIAQLLEQQTWFSPAHRRHLLSELVVLTHLAGDENAAMLLLAEVTPSDPSAVEARFAAQLARAHAIAGDQRNAWSWLRRALASTDLQRADPSQRQALAEAHVALRALPRAQKIAEPGRWADVLIWGGLLHKAMKVKTPIHDETLHQLAISLAWKGESSAARRVALRRSEEDRARTLATVAGILAGLSKDR